FGTLGGLVKLGQPPLGALELAREPLFVRPAPFCVHAQAFALLLELRALPLQLCAASGERALVLADDAILAAGLVLLGGAVVRGAGGAGAARSWRGFAVGRRRAAAIRRRHGAGAREQRLKAQRRELFGEPPEGLGLLRRRAACQRPQRARHAVEQRRRRRAAGLQNAARGVSQALQRGLLVSGGLVERAAPSACEHLPLGGVQARPRLEQLVEARALHAKQLVDGPGRHGGFLQGANGRGRCAVAFGQLAGQPVALGRE